MIGLEYVLNIRQIQYKEICEKIGVSQQTFQDWLKKRRKIPNPRLISLQNILNVSEELISREVDDIDKVELLKMEISRLIK